MVMGANGTTPIKRLGSWLARSVNTVYQAPTDGSVFYYKTGGASEVTQIKTDAANPPTIVRHHREGSNYGVALSCDVRKNDYWKCEDNAVGVNTIYWIPLEP